MALILITLQLISRQTLSLKAMRCHKSQSNPLLLSQSKESDRLPTSHSLDSLTTLPTMAVITAAVLEVGITRAFRRVAPVATLKPKPRKRLELRLSLTTTMGQAKDPEMVKTTTPTITTTE